MEQYWDGYSSALKDMEEGKVESDSKSIPTNPKQTA